MAQVERPSGDQHEVSNTRAASNTGAVIPFSDSRRELLCGPLPEGFQWSERRDMSFHVGDSGGFYAAEQLGEAGQPHFHQRQRFLYDFSRSLFTRQDGAAETQQGAFAMTQVDIP